MQLLRSKAVIARSMSDEAISSFFKINEIASLAMTKNAMVGTARSTDNLPQPLFKKEGR